MATAFIRGLSVEHREFVDRLAQSPSLLSPCDGNLAEMLAFQARLTRQFFDLQRLLLERSVRLDADIAALDAAAAAAALGESDFPDDDLVGADADIRQSVAALAATVVQTQHDVESLSHVLDEAFVSDEMRLHSVLDEVTLMVERCRVEAERVAERRLADARARAATLVHLARVERAAAAGEPAVVAQLPVGPAVLADDLDALLAQFDDGLPADTEIRWLDDEAPVTPPTNALFTLDGPMPSADAFWGRARVRPTSRRRVAPLSNVAAFVLAAVAVLRVK